MHASEVLSGRIDRGYGDHLPKGTTISLRRSKLNLVTHEKCIENGLQFDHNVARSRLRSMFRWILVR